MKISVSWLQDFLPSFNPDIQSLVDKLTFLGFEVEEVCARQLPDDYVVVGRIESVERHPDADRLTVCRVDTGGSDPLQIVCGAPNVRQGMIVPVATVGARLIQPDGEVFAIRKSKIRGVHSFGMICAADELGLSEDHSGVMELDASLAPGIPVSTVLKGDVMLDIAVTPNRPDVLSHLGLSRELAPPEELVLPARHAVDFAVTENIVEIMDPEACPYYTAVVIRGVTVRESPAWLKERLESIGLKPKNNIVDITNYILHALGQPLHAFDLAKLAGGRVIVRSDSAASFTLLNQETCTIRTGMPVICDAEKPVALAGVMGGSDSSVTSETTDILLESAYFSPSRIRKSAKQAGIASDSSYRFERGVDPTNVRRAAECAVALILELAGGEIASAQESGVVPAEGAPITLRTERVNAILGSAIGPEAMKEILVRLGFRCEETTEEGSMVFRVPSWRVDAIAEIDLIEEIARVYGYDNIVPAERMVTSYPASRTVPEYFPDHLRGIVAGLNFREILTNPLIRRSEAELFDQRVVAALNPISEGLEVLRPSLVPAFLKVIAHNLRHGNRDLRFFEVARGFTGNELKGEDDEASPLDVFHEREYLVMALSGARHPRLWNQLSVKSDVYDMTGAVEMLLEKLNLLEKSSLIVYNESTVGIDVILPGKKGSHACSAGTVRMIDAAMLREFDIGQEVFLAELDVAVLQSAFTAAVTYEPPSRFPVVQRDLSFILPEGIAVRKLVDVVRSSDPMIRNVSVFDQFERTSLNGKENSVALSLDIVDYDRTLQDERISDILDKAGSEAGKQLGAVIRQV
ncbi:MAG: phenylalanine--tRNA ligase subunit beta [Chlorobium sp.]|uniref:phenylalanine--tRNA ligase subunit beta n=1 Tax=Chlorobium sp. TaxID=1095 RepID=UPI0025BDBC55|nr:phenylalanine--tRNA ligase subunit beta [Chlorobium sp.]MCF8216506.1 phenylalanine--tRNA ligase subunit beta [Chlorobium sp.]MCF8271411.1 phenylalanine--tRNA ligase subunit beta [Chlorobium sp.]MCF8287783.1 phenylalanine--tRNA ligase subunit beta [Chlorobium sp.]MCF8291322.1 phenylalanine--tRNA ligase subunit beta [Chlorobium sp.]MCF8385417.1 phenylalanine--tRNA ligase subunit beta [Chlorobium sp.]